MGLIMKITLRMLCAFLFSSITFVLSAQSDTIQTDTIQTDTIQSDTVSAVPTSKQVVVLLEDIRIRQIKETYANRFKMYPTENMYNLLKLDTQTGQIEQVQWSLDEDKEFTSTINSQDLSWETGMNSFELYPTKNMYQFVLLDKSSGRTWHVQWGLKSSERWIKRIY